MSALSRQFVLELEFKVKNRNPRHPEKQLIIVDEASISELSKLREDLANFTTEPFIIQYVDEENDLVSIDTEEEFKEFTKTVMQRSSKGEVQKIVLNCNPISVSEKKLSSNAKAEKKLPTTIYLPKDIAKQQWTAFALRECYKRIYNGGVIKEWQIKYKNELKQEILSEMKEELGAAFQPNVSRKEFDEYEEDSDGNFVCRHEKKKMKLNHNHKKLEKKEKQVDKKKIDQRIEKLELKKKKLMEKAYQLRTAYKYSVASSSFGLPTILSGVVTKDTVFVSKKVATGKVFFHQWRVINDGTVLWKDVQLQHTWSTPGLEPDDLIVRCPALFPGQECLITMKFRAPKTIGPFVSYWHFVNGPKLQQFGHYVPLTGDTELSNLTSSSVEQTEEQGDHEMTDKKTVSFNDEAGACLVTCINALDGANYAENERIKKHLDASLASAEIAAEMAREAANAALRVASGMQTDKNEILSEMDQVIKNCQNLHLEGSDSDTDVNIDVNEETDPEFVIVNIPSSLPTEQNKPQAKNIHTLNMDSVKEEKKPNMIQNQKNDEIVTLPCELKDIKIKQDDISTNTSIDNKPNVPKEVIEVAQEVSEPPQFDPATMTFNLNLNNAGPNVQKSFTKLPNDQQALNMGYPKLDPNVNYPVMGPPPRVTMAMYPPQQHPTHAYSPMFAPQNSSSHGIVFPPPLMNYIPTPKINPPHYPQIPIPIPFPTVMASPPEVPMQHAPLPSSAFQPIMTRGSLPVSQNVPRDVFSCEGFTGNTIQQTVGSQVSSVSKPEIPEASNTLHTKTNKNVEDKSEKPNQQVLINNATTESASSTNVTENRHVPMHGDGNGDATVQILPQGLVDGAINVASTAYSHAWNALNNLRPKECHAQEFDPVFENNMALLIEMGFRNVERNARLLKRFKNDLSQVIGVICASPGGDNLEID